MRAVKLVHNIPQFVCSMHGCHESHPCKRHPISVGVLPAYRLRGEGTRRTTCTHGHHTCAVCGGTQAAPSKEVDQAVTDDLRTRWEEAVHFVSGYFDRKHSPWEARVEPVTLGYTFAIEGLGQIGSEYLSREDAGRYTDYQLKILVQNIFDRFKKANA